MGVDWTRLRENMVAEQISRRGVHDPRVLDAMRNVPRERFVPEELVALAYDDSALPIGQQQTISQPYVVALMTQALELGPDDRVLEIGTGSGYAAAVLAEIAGQVFSIERYESLATTARRRLQELGYRNVEVLCADGTLGWPNQAPFDAIVVTAGSPAVPESLRMQLALGGRLVIPVGDAEHVQRLVRIRRTPDLSYQEDDLGLVRFVPLVGEGDR